MIPAHMDIISTLLKHRERHGSQKAMADSLGVSETYLSDVLRGRKEPGDKILKPLGIERRVIYRRIRRQVQ